MFRYVLAPIWCSCFVVIVCNGMAAVASASPEDFQDGRKRRALQRDKGRNFVLFGYSGGIGNQLQALAHAARLSGLLNRTLIVPPILSHLTMFGQESGILGERVGFGGGIECKRHASIWAKYILSKFDAVVWKKAPEWDSVFDFTAVLDHLDVVKYSDWHNYKMHYESKATCFDEATLLESLVSSKERVVFVGNTYYYTKQSHIDTPAEQAIKTMRFSKVIRVTLAKVLQTLKWPTLNGSQVGEFTALQLRVGDKPRRQEFEHLLKEASAQKGVRADTGHVWLGGDFFARHAEWIPLAQRSEVCRHTCAHASDARLQPVLAQLRDRLQQHAYPFLDMAFFSTASKFVHVSYRSGDGSTFATAVMWKRQHLRSQSGSLQARKRHHHNQSQ